MRHARRKRWARHPTVRLQNRWTSRQCQPVKAGRFPYGSTLSFLDDSLDGWFVMRAGRPRSMICPRRIDDSSLSGCGRGPR